MINPFDPAAKILANMDYVEKFLKTGISSPILVEVDPSNTCNHACGFCISSYIHLPESKGLETYDKSIMPREQLLTLSEDLIKIKTKAINWTGGGEPTVNPSLKEAVQLVSKSPVKMGMFTNGTMLDKFDLFETLADNMSWVRLSIDAGTEESYNNIRRVKPAYDWNKMVSNMKELIRVRNKSGSKMDIGVGFVLTPDNYTEIIEFAKFFNEFDIAYCQFKPEIVNKEREGGKQRTLEFFNNLKPYFTEAESILGDKFQVNDYKVTDLKEDRNFFGRTYKKCLGSQVSPCVGADGNVYVCTNHRGYKQYSYGSIYDKSFIDIWNDISVRNNIMKVIEEEEEFSNCTALCKPHESNKILYSMYEGYHESPNKEKYLKALKEQAKGVSPTHPEFI
tara:strand:+ start:6218 stop:7396 length:1179 start_codon:yes stop_codon:yes gene_type:complete